jgi:hypothetical protein
MPLALRSMLDSVDSKVERFLLHRQTSGSRVQSLWIASGVGTAFLLATLVKAMSGGVAGAGIDLFAMPVVLGCFFFRRHALMVVDAAILCDFLVSWQTEVGWGKPGWPSLAMLSGIIVQGLELALLGAFVSITLEKWVALRTMGRRTEEDLELAKALQSSLINQSYSLGRVAIEGSINQCSAVGGDFFYFRPFEKKMVTFCLGDVMGKGISASLIAGWPVCGTAKRAGFSPFFTPSSTKRRAP